MIENFNAYLNVYKIVKYWYYYLFSYLFLFFLAWQVPGEGEHKIIDFIRYHKAQPGYDPNTQHCLYGLDDDLVSRLMGCFYFWFVKTHEKNFLFLKENK